MKIKALGHVVLRVTDCARAEQFYGGVLGLPVCARLDEHGTRKIRLDQLHAPLPSSKPSR